MGPCPSRLTQPGRSTLGGNRVASDELRDHERAVRLQKRIDTAVELVHRLVHHGDYDAALVKVSAGDKVVAVKCCSCEDCGGDVYLIEPFGDDD